jgi:hypothetical protein
VPRAEGASGDSLLRGTGQALATGGEDAATSPQQAKRATSLPRNSREHCQIGQVASIQTG